MARPDECRRCGAADFRREQGKYICNFCDAPYEEPEIRGTDRFERAMPREEKKELKTVPVTSAKQEQPRQEYRPQPEAPVRTFEGEIVNPTPAQTGTPKNKWVAFFLCLFLGPYGAHKFYEGKIGMGILYLLTAGLFGIGWIVDCIRLAMNPDPYYVN